MAQSLLESDDGLELAGERRRVAVLMADLRGFTALTERVEPTVVVAILNQYLATMSEVIGDHGGTIDDFIGDGILALFGALDRRDDDAARAVACALSMQQSLGSVNDLIAARTSTTLEMGIGIATGEVIVGTVGSEEALQIHRHRKRGESRRTVRRVRRPWGDLDIAGDLPGSANSGAGR